MQSNKYWDSFKELENQILILSRNINFDDNNFSNNVHSVVIANLILQCAANIESIAKDIFLKYCSDNEKKDRKELFYDGDCLNWAIKNWGINKRSIICKLMPEGGLRDNWEYIPFAYQKTKKIHNKNIPIWQWNEAYQDIKHDYLEAISRSATIHNLIEIAAAFYMLILYYEDVEVFPEIKISGYWLDVNNTYFCTSLFYLSSFDDSKSDNIAEEENSLFFIEHGKFVDGNLLVPIKAILNKKC